MGPLGEVEEGRIRGAQGAQPADHHIADHHETGQTLIAEPPQYLDETSVILHQGVDLVEQQDQHAALAPERSGLDPQIFAGLSEKVPGSRHEPLPSKLDSQGLEKVLAGLDALQIEEDGLQIGFFPCPGIDLIEQAGLTDTTPPTTRMLARRRRDRI